MRTLSSIEKRKFERLLGIVSFPVNGNARQQQR